MNDIVIGLDEVGRGALAGPLVVGAVIIPNPSVLNDLPAACGVRQLRDSKKLTQPQRERIVEWISSRVIWGVGEASPGEIDELGLTAATKLAAGRAYDAATSQGHAPTRALLDAGLFHPYEDRVSTERFIKGDEKIPEIALASIIAKVSRDRQMAVLGIKHDMYGFDKNVGYGTRFHLDALRQHGASSHHRKLFLKKLDF